MGPGTLEENRRFYRRGTARFVSTLVTGVVCLFVCRFVSNFVSREGVSPVRRMRAAARLPRVGA